MNPLRPRNHSLPDPLPFEDRQNSAMFQKSLSEDLQAPDPRVWEALKGQLKQPETAPLSGRWWHKTEQLLTWRIPVYQALALVAFFLVLLSYAGWTGLQRPPQRGNWPAAFQAPGGQSLADSLGAPAGGEGRSLYEDSLLTPFIHTVM